MSDDLRTFNRHVTQWFQDEPDEQMRLYMQVIALDAFSRLILRTPVDTGRAKSNWQVGIGEVPDGVLARTNPSGALSDGERALSEMRGLPIVSLVNNLPYIERLEQGHSKQAPAGMLEQTYQELLSMVA